MTMSLNKFLCKWFDFANKGYVTIGDFGFGLLLYSIIVLFMRYIAYGTYYLLNILYYNTGESYSGTQQLSVIVAGVIIGSICVGMTLHISSIKIAECPLRTEENEGEKQ